MLIGIDAGGTKTDILIADNNGLEQKNVCRAGVNAARLGAARAAETLAGYLIDAKAENALALYAGVAGAGTSAIARSMETRFKEILPGIAGVRVDSDAFNALNAEIGLNDGIALIAGTGSASFLRKDGFVWQAGGRGCLIDDAGSGYSVGRACLNSAYRSIDGRGPHTTLCEMLENAIGARLSDAIPTIYNGGPSFIASFAPLAFRATDMGDEITANIVEECAGELALLVRTVARNADFTGLCVASGGLFRAQRLKTEIAKHIGDITLLVTDKPPVRGALAAAASIACL